jgi:hypothetical protein
LCFLCGEVLQRGGMSVGGPDPKARKEFGSFALFLLDQIIRW